jgi:hypothetical protein
MPKKTLKAKTRNKRQNVRSIQPSERIEHKPAVVPQSSTKAPMSKSTTTTSKTMPSYSYLFTELKVAGTIAGIILILIIILWLIMR